MDFSGRKAQLLLIYLLAFVAAIGNPLVLPCMPAIMEEFQLTPLQLGMILSLYALPGIFAIPLYGVLSDRIGRRPLLLITLLLCLIGSLICYFAPTYTWILVGRMFQGMSITPLESLSNTLATDLFEGDARKKLITRIVVMQYFGIAIVPILISLLLFLGDWRICFLFAAGLGLVSLLICLPIRIPYVPSSTVTFQLYAQHLGHLLGSIRLLSLFAVRGMSALLLFGIVYAHVPVLVAERFPESVSSLGFFFSIYAIGMFCGALGIARFTGFSQKIIAVTGGMQLFMAMLLLGFAANYWTTMAAMVFTGVGSSLLNATCVGHVSLATTPDTRGSIMSAYSTVFRTGQAVAPLLCGLVYQVGGFHILFGLAAIVAAVLTKTAMFSFSFAHRMEHSQDIH